MYPTEPFVRSILGPYEPQICQIIDRAWRRMSGLPGRASFDFKRTVATIMHQCTMNEVRATFTGLSDIKLLEGHETIRLLIDQRLVVRLKKMDKRGFTRAQPTQATFAFTTPNTMLPFASKDVPDICTVDVGYVLNYLGTRIEMILVAARHGDVVIWSYPAEGGRGEAVASITPTPMHPASSATIIKLPVNRKDRVEDDRK